MMTDGAIPETDSLGLLTGYDAIPDRNAQPSNIYNAVLPRPAMDTSQPTQASAVHCQPTGLGLRMNNGPKPSVWDALNAFARHQDDDSITTSRLPSTAAPSIAGSQRLNPSRMFKGHTSQHPARIGLPLIVPGGKGSEHPTEDLIASATEVATPSITGTPDIRIQEVVPPSQPRNPALQANDQCVGQEQVATSVNTRNASQTAPKDDTPMPVELQNLVRSCVQRLDILESYSFSNVPVQEIEDKFELFEGRLLDLEGWRADHEAHSGSFENGSRSTRKNRRLLPAEMDSFSSNTSSSSKTSAHISAVTLAATAEMEAKHIERANELEERIQALEERTPSYGRPWHVEVVLLPWGRNLGGIWSAYENPAADSSRAPTQTSEEWNGVGSPAKTSFVDASAQNSGWTTDSIRAWADAAEDWLSPKACGPNGVVYKRLQSRGLVRKVTLNGTDAHGVIAAIMRVFSEFFNEVSPAEIDLYAKDKFQALGECVIPLRKVRKSSRLRFLNPAEMVTSATWDALFLDASVFMKAKGGQQRLYVTTPAAYVQAGIEGWTWQKLRELPRVRSNNHSDGEVTVGEADALEPYWAHHPTLDPPSVQTSFGSNFSHQSQWSTRSQTSQHAQSQDGEQLAHELSSVAPVVTPASELRLTVDTRRQTVSLPASSAELPSFPNLKRRVASFEQTSTSSTHHQQHHKRPRMSKSPEAERGHGVNFTPRWSREPPSPFTSEVYGETRSQAQAAAAAAAKKRGGTPFAYATPHSNTVITMPFISSGGDTEADSSVARSENGEEEWEGVVDEDMQVDASETEDKTGASGDIADSDGDDGDDYNEDLEDEGLTIYEERLLD
ncbi:hypothetical protein H2203_007091 [Taxawa tesnikishii (nom. ined.)]|nr:hypothetical protein H2203_007091 [Dothideales sp. JES 119]